MPNLQCNHFHSICFINQTIKTHCKHVWILKSHDLAMNQNNSTKTLIPFLFHTRKALHSTFHSQILNCSAYYTKKITPQRIQFEEQNAEHKQYWNTHNFSTPNLNPWLKMGRKWRFLGSPMLCFTLSPNSALAHPETHLSLSNSCSFQGSTGSLYNGFQKDQSSTIMPIHI